MTFLTIVQRERAPRDPLILRSRIASSAHASRSFSARDDDDLYRRKLSRAHVRADIALTKVGCTFVKRISRESSRTKTRTRARSRGAHSLCVLQEKFARFRKCAGDVKDKGDPILNFY